MNATHIPTGRTCRIMRADGDHFFCDFGDATNPFTWVKTAELRVDPPRPMEELRFSPRCLITGCTLIVGGRKWVRGDLHSIGDCYVFNAVQTPQGVTAWVYERPVQEDMVITLDEETYYERRGVIVFAKEVCDMTMAVWVYIGGHDD